MVQPTLINLHPNEYSEEFHYYPFGVKLDVWKLEVVILLSNNVLVTNKTEDLNLSVFNMITGINESKTLTKHVPCECKCKFDGKNVIQINGRITINVDVSVKHHICEKILFGILLHVVAKMVNT